MPTGLNYNADKLRQDLITTNWSSVYNTRNVSIFQTHAPLINKRIKGRPCPWLNPALKNIMNSRDKILRGKVIKKKTGSFTNSRGGRGTKIYVYLP